MIVQVNLKVTKKSLGKENETIETIQYDNVYGYTFETIEELDNKMCIVLHLSGCETATFTCDSLVSIENL